MGCTRRRRRAVEGWSLKPAHCPATWLDCALVCVVCSAVCTTADTRIALSGLVGGGGTAGQRGGRSRRSASRGRGGATE